MITGMAFAMFLGLLVFGPKKTLEMSQTVGRVVANLKHAASQLQTQILESQQPEYLSPSDLNRQLRNDTKIGEPSDHNSAKSSKSIKLGAVSVEGQISTQH